jgi:urease accessory protein
MTGPDHHHERGAATGPAGTAATLALLLLGDGRFPAGGHAHSAGAESAVADGRIHDLASLEAFVEGRLWTAGLVDASLAAATAHRVGRCDDLDGFRTEVRLLDREADARAATDALRAASRRLGRQLVRVSSRCWPAADLVALIDELPDGAHLPVALGAVGVVAGLGPVDVARLTVHHTTTTAAQAALRLLGLDPYEVAASTVRLGAVATAVVDDALAWSTTDDLGELPARTGPIVEIAAVEHRRWDRRLFAT